MPKRACVCARTYHQPRHHRVIHAAPALVRPQRHALVPLRGSCGRLVQELIHARQGAVLLRLHGCLPVGQLETGGVGVHAPALCCVAYYSVLRHVGGARAGLSLCAITACLYDCMRAEEEGARGEGREAAQQLYCTAALQKANAATSPPAVQRTSQPP